MRAAALHRQLGSVIVALALLGLHATAHAQQCTSSCSRARGVCAMQARTALSGCLHGCAFGDFQCRAACMTSWRAARAICRATRTDCMTTCPPAAASAGAASAMIPCTTGCSATAKSCFADVLAMGAACADGCGAAGGEPKSCLEQCAAAIGAKSATCLAAFQGCVVGCQGQGAGACFSTVAMECTAQPCGPGQPCVQPEEFCSERCATTPSSGTCLDLATGECTTATCSPNQPCAATGQTCVPLCPPPTPQGKCFDPAARACTEQVCDTAHGCVLANQICTLQCPMRTPVPQCAGVPCEGSCALLPPCPSGAPCPEFPSRVGQCVSDSAGVCGCVPASPPPTRTPQPTQTLQCDAAACGGPCAIALPFPCPDGKVCASPDLVLQGQCAITAAGSCDCMPVRPTPLETSTPQCGGDRCGGPCLIGPICPPGALCPEPAFVLRTGTCTAEADGSCQCAPVSPAPTTTPRPTRTPQCNSGACDGPCTIDVPFVCPDGEQCRRPNDAAIQGRCASAADGSCDCLPIAPTPPATPTPQCSGPMCGGPCVIGPPCPPGKICPAVEFAVGRGECALDANGGCQCVPVSPPATRTPQPTRTPQCSGAICGGDCTISFPFPCPAGAPCDAPSAPDLQGQCTIIEDGSCECVPVQPTPPATPTPQCSDAMCGGSCVVGPTCPPGKVCPARALVVRPGQCMIDAAGACECVAVAPPTPTPGCASDADCKDDNACTADRCVNGECEHDCLCLSSNGGEACCPGPSALCVASCGSDATGTCGGFCPTGASCEAAASANGGCGCVSGPGGPCGGNILAPPPVCAPGLVCHQSLPDVTGYCEKPDCVPLFTSGCSHTSDCCEPCGNGTIAPCGVCINGTCEGAP